MGEGRGRRFRGGLGWGVEMLATDSQVTSSITMRVHMINTKSRRLKFIWPCFDLISFNSGSDSQFIKVKKKGRELFGSSSSS